MPAPFLVFALLAALLHLLFFGLESLAWRAPAVRRIFRQTEAQAETTRGLAFNQGFYNLFLAVEIAIGLWLIRSGRPAAGRALAVFALASMLAAAGVLLAWDRKMIRGALIQGLPPLVALASLWRAGR